MNNFEFFFSLFGVLFGFVLVEVLSGFVRTVKAHKVTRNAGEHQIRVGWLTPILGLYVLLDISSYWANLWDIRTRVPVGFDTIFGLLFITGVYYFAASLVFPDEAESWPDLDDWFWLRRRLVLGCIFAVNLVWIPVWKLLGPGGVGVVEALLQLLYFLPLLIAIFAKEKPRLVGGAIASICLVYLGLGVAALISHLSGG